MAVTEILLLPSFKAEARFEVKTRNTPEVTISGIFLPHFGGWFCHFFRDRDHEFVVNKLQVCLLSYFRDRGIREFVVARL